MPEQKFVVHLKNGKNSHMKKILIASIISCLGIIACETKTPTFSEQLQKNFQSRLWKTDSTLMLDSFSILRIDTANQRLVDKVQDTTYKLTLYKVQGQLANATASNKTDSMAFYKEELDYMIPTSDSLAKLVDKSDTTKKYGIVVACKTQVSKGNATVNNTIYYYLNLDLTAMNTDWLDAEIAQLSDQLNIKTK
jgi:hypothetical protein